MPPAPKRRWLRFSLRTMFVAMTVLSCCLAWLAYDWNWAQQRREALKPPYDPLAVVVSTGYSSRKNIPAAPWSLRLFNAEGIEIITLDPRISAERMASERIRVQSLFPEARVIDASAEEIEVFDQVRAEVGITPRVPPESN